MFALLIKLEKSNRAMQIDGEIKEIRDVRILGILLGAGPVDGKITDAEKESMSFSIKLYLEGRREFCSVERL